MTSEAMTEKIGTLARSLLTTFATSAETQKWYRSRSGAGVDVVATWDDEHATFKADGFIRNFNSGTMSDDFCRHAVRIAMNKADMCVSEIIDVQEFLQNERLPNLIQFLHRGLN